MSEWNLEEPEYVARQLAGAVLHQSMMEYAWGKGDVYEEAKRWFEDKSRDTFGFYWCLAQCNANPNLVRKFIDMCDTKHLTKRGNWLPKCWGTKLGV